MYNNKKILAGTIMSCVLLSGIGLHVSADDESSTQGTSNFISQFKKNKQLHEEKGGEKIFSTLDESIQAELLTLKISHKEEAREAMDVLRAKQFTEIKEILTDVNGGEEIVAQMEAMQEEKMALEAERKTHWESLSEEEKISASTAKKRGHR